MTKPVFLDAGPLVAYLDDMEQYHNWAVEKFSELPGPFLLPEAVMSETCFLLRDQPKALAKIGNFFERGLLSIASLGSSAQPRVFAMMEKYRTVPMSYADACLLWLKQIPVAASSPRIQISTFTGWNAGDRCR